MVATAKVLSDDFNLISMNYWCSHFLASSNHLTRNPDRKNKLWNIGSDLRDIYFTCRSCWNFSTYKWKNSKCENWNHLFYHKDSFETGCRCQFRGVGQGMKCFYLYRWFLLFKAQWDSCDQQTHGTWNVKRGLFHFRFSCKAPV